MTEGSDTTQRERRKRVKSQHIDKIAGRKLDKNTTQGFHLAETN